MKLAYAFVQEAFAPNSKIMSAIKTKLGDKRVSVLIDDLDRAHPSILPDLFLALRDVLDTPGFVYILAFDKGIVSHALTDERLAFGDGGEFQEKLFDFTFDIPSVSGRQLRRLLTTECELSCDFADLHAIKDIFHLLPRNPRKLKKFIRHIAVLRDQVARHDPDELNWPLIYICQLIRLESEPYLWWLLDELDGENFDLLGFLGGRRDDEAAAKEKISKLIEPSGKKSDSQKANIEKLVLGLIDHAGLMQAHQKRYSAEIWINPHAVTWKEFRELFAAWRDNREEFDLNAWAVSQAENTGHSTTRVADELF